MDVLEQSYAYRARAALDMLMNEGATPPTERKAAAFTTIARRLLSAGRNDVGIAALKAHEPSELVQKAVAQVLDADELWSGPLAQQLAAAYIASVAEQSIFDQLKVYARVLPPRMRQVMIATAAVGNVVSEGAPKPVRDLTLNLGDVDFLKAVGIVVMSKELASATGGEGAALFEQELQKATVRALNRSVLTAFIDSGTSVIAAGTDPLASLRAGLQAAGPSEGFVVAMSAGDAAWLATSEANRGGMGVRGGEFVRGVHIVVMDDHTGMTIIPASRVGIYDGGLSVRSTDQADVDMRDTPESPGAKTSLWQTNSAAIIVERQWQLVSGGAEAVTVEG
ncbi:hypothetical protein [Hydrogenophaga sp.]|uniref:hypothetical protein n=1 Tax=Hydrogenophaga sp. TaxID=1904254 RepID=UPI002FCBE0BA